MTAASFTLVFEHSDFLIINKVAGVNFHDEGALGSGLFSQVKDHFNYTELYPVHRLDKMTSGLIIVAKTLACAQYFQQQFSAHNIDKYYLALSDIKPKKKQGLIIGDMTKSRRGAWKLLRTTNNPAITQFFSYALANKVRLYCLKPHSGKTHQIRVALASIGAPILGDVYYYPQSKQSQLSPERGYLHAYSLSFVYQNAPFAFTVAPSEGRLFLSDECQEQLAQIEAPSALDWPKISYSKYGD